jgi:hypothetical protein
MGLNHKYWYVFSRSCSILEPITYEYSKNPPSMPKNPSQKSKNTPIIILLTNYLHLYIFSLLLVGGPILMIWIILIVDGYT